MATYLMLFSFTQQGIERIKEIGARIEAAKKVIQQKGGKVQTFYAILGSEYDTLFILTAPSEEKVAEMALAIGMLGNVRTQTHRLFSEEEVGNIVTALP
ncbi:MAG: GYD domain-containing protein [Acidobacteriota bacterium]|jgi:uncharacterized protein with GYD domain